MLLVILAVTLRTFSPILNVRTVVPAELAINRDVQRVHPSRTVQSLAFVAPEYSAIDYISRLESEIPSERDFSTEHGGIVPVPASQQDWLDPGHCQG